MKFTVIFTSFLSFALLPFNMAQATLIINGGFEQTTTNISTPEGWSISGGNPVAPAAIKLDPVVPASSGDWAVDLGVSGIDSTNGGSLFQTFSVTDTGSYIFSFDYSNESHNSSLLADFSWSLSGLIADGGNLLNIGGGYVNFAQEYSVDSLGEITVSFSDFVGNGHAFDAIIDNVTFLANPVPAPPAVWLMFSGLIGLFGTRKKLVKLAGKDA